MISLKVVLAKDICSFLMTTIPSSNDSKIYCCSSLSSLILFCSLIKSSISFLFLALRESRMSRKSLKIIKNSMKTQIMQKITRGYNLPVALKLNSGTTMPNCVPVIIGQYRFFIICSSIKWQIIICQHMKPVIVHSICFDLSTDKFLLLTICRWLLTWWRIIKCTINLFGLLTIMSSSTWDKMIMVKTTPPTNSSSDTVQ